MIFHIYYLSHVFHLVTSDSLASWRVVGHVHTLTCRSKVCNAVRKILVLWCRTMTFKWIEVELILIWCSTDASFIYMMRGYSTSAMILFLNHLSVKRIIHHLLLRISQLVVISVMCSIGRMMNLLIISTSLRSSLKLILYLLSLLFIGFSDWDTLANLLKLWSIQWMHLLMGMHHNSSALIRRFL